MINPREIFEGVEFDLDEGLDNLIPKMFKILELLDSDRANNLADEYFDVLKNVKFSSVENKDFFFEDLVDNIDRSLPAGWTFGPDEEFSATYAFMKEVQDDGVF